MTLLGLKIRINLIFCLSNEPTLKVTRIYYPEFFISLAYDKHFDYYLKYKLLKIDLNVQDMLAEQEFEL